MSDPIDVKRGDVGVTFTDQLQAMTAAGTLAPIDCTGGTLLFLMRNVRNASGTVDVSGSGTITAGTLGLVSYTTVAGDLAVTGDFSHEWQLTKGAQVLTVPSSGYNRIRVGEDLN